MSMAPLAPTASDDRRAIECSVGDEALFLVREGASRSGGIYRDRDRGCFVRLIPMPEASAAARTAVRDFARGGTNLPDVAAVRREFAVSLGVGYYAIEYASPPGARTLGRTLATDPPFVRMKRMADVAERLSKWRRAIDAPAFLSPHDIVLDDAGEPSLLPLPGKSLPDSASVLAETERALYLAPEYLRGAASSAADFAGVEALDRYAWGVCLLRSLFELPVPTRPEELLLDAATGALVDAGRGTSSLPESIRRLSAAAELQEIAAEACAVSPSRRLRRSEAETARAVRDCAERLDPVRVLRDAVLTLPPLEAFFELQNLLTEHESRDLLLMGAALAERFARPLDAIEYYERAIKGSPDDAEAYSAVFRLIAEARTPGHPLQDVYRRSLEVGAQLDRRLFESHQAMSRLNPAAAKQSELKVAKHYLWRAEQLPVFYQNAANFVRPRIIGADNRPLFYKAELNVAFCEALFGQGRVPDAKSYLERVAAELEGYRSRGRMDKAELDRAFRWIDDLRRRIAAAEERHAS